MRDSVGVSVHGGFPNAADDDRLQGLSLDKRFVQNPRSTFFFEVTGDTNTDGRLQPGDTAIIDRALQPSMNDLVIWWGSDEFVIGPLKNVPSRTQVWGVITAVVHTYRSLPRG